jgi:hypothetical protein
LEISICIRSNEMQMGLLKDLKLDQY